MEHSFYLIALVLSICGLAVLDWRQHLAFFHDAKRTAMTLTLGVALFVIWDLLGIHLGIFFTNNSRYTLGIFLTRELPVEEVFFLILLCYSTLITYLGLKRKC